MEICPKCHKFTAERNHYNGKLICYNRECLYQEQLIEMDKMTSAKEIIALNIGYHFWEAKNDDEAIQLGMDCAIEVMEALEKEGLTF